VIQNGLKFLLLFLAIVFAGCQSPSRYTPLGKPVSTMPTPSQVLPPPPPPPKSQPPGPAQPDPLRVECNRWLGTPYRLGGASRSGVDCSGLTCQVYQNVYNLKLPRTAAEQFNRGRNVTTVELKPGDLVFFQTSPAAPVTHVGIYLGHGAFIHSSTRSGVILSRLYEGYYSQSFRGAKRIK
jgi:cell wall-associated NlpC family hydrolase